MLVIEKIDSEEVLQPVRFASESELEEVICKYPELLQRGNEPKPFLVKRQLNLASGIADVLMTNSEGLPIAAEVKLSRNPGARREIIGQIVDYVSSLTSMTADEVDEGIDGALESTLRDKAADEEKFKKLWRDFGTKLRAGTARYILVLDEAPQELERMVRFLARNSSLDIRLVVISKYRACDNQIMFVPTNVVDEEDSQATKKLESSAVVTSEGLVEACNAFNGMPISKDFKLRGTAPRYRQIRPQSWPRNLHYEFREPDGKLCVELHLEGDEVTGLAKTLRTFNEHFLKVCNTKIRWDSNWYGRRGRLVCDMPSDVTPKQAAEVMNYFIEATRDQVTKAWISLKNNA